MSFTKNRLYNLLTNMVYVGKVDYAGQVYEGEHEAIVDPGIWQSVQDRLRYLTPKTRRPADPEQVRGGTQGDSALRQLRRGHGPHLHAEDAQQALPLLRLRERSSEGL